jgi:hypothetical protein
MTPAPEWAPAALDTLTAMAPQGIQPRPLTVEVQFVEALSEIQPLLP